MRSRNRPARAPRALPAEPAQARRGGLRGAACLILALLQAGLAPSCRSAEALRNDTAGWSASFDDPSWDDGMAVVLVFEGRVRRYGVWREAQVRDYLVREYLDPGELTKRDVRSPELVPVLKANRLTSFSTGSYDYGLMSSLHFSRDSGSLTKGVGACTNACGIVHQRWDAPSGELVVDSYWEDEGRLEVRLPAGGWRFADELFFVAQLLPDGAQVDVVPPLASPRAIVRSQRQVEDPLDSWIGFGDICVECRLPLEGALDPGHPGASSAIEVPRHVLHVEREGRRTRFVGEDGVVELELVCDAQGFVEAWTLRGEQEFRRVAVYRGPYWERTDPEHRSLVEAP